MRKLRKNLAEAIEASGLRDGMAISFHHHLRSGDFVLNQVLEAVERAGIRDLTVRASAVFNVHAPLIEAMRKGIVTGLECSYMDAGIGRAVTQGVLAKPVVFRSHGGRASAIENGETPVDVAFLAAPAADPMGNCSGKYGPSACGSLGYAFADARHAKRVVVICDTLLPYPLADFSIPETCVDDVVVVDRIGEAAGIVSGTTNLTRDPVGLRMASYAARVIERAGLIRDGFSFQAGAGGATLAAVRDVRDLMIKGKVKGSFGMGGITRYMVEMLEQGCFEALLDVQCFDLEAVRSIRENPRHREISAAQYAGTGPRGSAVDQLDAVLLGATEVDLDFNVNVHTDSNGFIMGGSGGHSDTAAGAKLALVVAPLLRARLPLITGRVCCVTTPGATVDAVVTQYGIAVNPRREDLRKELIRGGLPVKDIAQLKALAEEMAGVPDPLPEGGRVVARVLYRDGSLLDTIRQRPVS